MLWKFRIVAEDLFGRTADTVDAGGVDSAVETFARRHPELQGVPATVAGKLQERQATVPFLHHHQIVDPPPTLLNVGRWREPVLRAELDAERRQQLLAEIASPHRHDQAP